MFSYFLFQEFHTHSFTSLHSRTHKVKQYHCFNILKGQLECFGHKLQINVNHCYHNALKAMTGPLTSVTLFMGHLFTKDIKEKKQQQQKKTNKTETQAK